jgi:hypothetical protein
MWAIKANKKTQPTVILLIAFYLCRGEMSVLTIQLC